MAGRLREVGGIGKKQSPLKQAQAGLLSLLEKLPRDLQPSQACYSYLPCVAFTNLTHAEAIDLGLLKDHRLLPRTHPVLFADDLDDDRPFDRFIRAVNDAYAERGWTARPMLPRLAHRVWKKISPDANAAPERKHRRVSAAAKIDGVDPSITAILAKTKAGIHRVNGVVGSGKTLFLAHKALQIAKAFADGQQRELFAANRPILVLTLTVSSASKIRNDLSRIAEATYPSLTGHWESYVEVHHFHEFLQVHYGLRGLPQSYEDFLKKTSPRPMFRTILFDEFQDAQRGWGQFIAKNLSGSDALLLLTFDPAQGPGFVDLGVFFEEVRVAAAADVDVRWPSRSYYLRESHRVPRAIGELALRVHSELTAQEFEQSYDETVDSLAKVIGRALKPDFRAEGGKYNVHRCSPKDTDEEALEIGACIDRIVEESDASLGDIAVAVSPKEPVDLAEPLGELGIDPFLLDGQNRGAFFERGERVTIGTPIRLKGLEIPIVIVAPSLCRYLDETKRKDAFYLAATRATSELFVLGDSPSFDVVDRCAKGTENPG